MLSKKSATLASVMLLTFFAAPIAATAITPGHSASPVPIYLDDSDDHESDDDVDNDGDGEEDHESSHDERHENIPPVFVVPGTPQVTHPAKPGEVSNTPKPTPNSLTNITDNLKAAQLKESQFNVVSSMDPSSDSALAKVNPHQSKPIDVSLIRTTVKTPADQFMESAYIAMAGLGVTALGLGATAAVRAVRLRRAGKADYFYDND